MKKNGHILLLLCLFSLYGFSQSEQSFNGFLSSFDSNISGFCSDYSEKDKSILSWYTSESEPFENAEEYKADSMILHHDEIRQFILSGNDTVYVQNIWQLDTVAKEPLEEFLKEYTYYANSVVIDTLGFVGLIYEIVEEGVGSEKFFCTMDHQGKVISCIYAGFYTQSGTFTNGEGGRSPWYVLHVSCIDEKGIITKYDHNSRVNGSYEVLSRHRITREGKIIAMSDDEAKVVPPFAEESWSP